MIAAAAMAVTSCDSFFDINLKDQANLEDSMSRSASVKRYLAHLYAYIPRDENTRAYEGGTVLRSDESLNAKSQYETYWYKVKRGEHGSDNTTAESSANFWKRYYQGIAECTTFLDNVDLDKEDDPALVACMKAEARFLRAYYYFVLFRHYGPVYVWGDKAADQEIDPATMDRGSVKENIDFIVSELDKAAEDLPLAIGDTGISEGSNKGRATKGAALALKARVLLYAASPLYNGQAGTGMYDSFKDKDGKSLFDAYDASKWGAARDAAKAVIDLGPYSLVKTEVSGNTAFQNAAASYQNVWFERWNTNTEIIWGWWYRSWADESLGTVGGDIAYAAPSGGKIALAGYSLNSPSLRLVDAYPMAESGRYPVLEYEKTSGMLDFSRPVVDPLSGYQASGFTDDYQQLIDVDPAWATPFKAHNSTVGRDARYYSNFVPNGFWWPSSRTYSGGPLRFTCYDSAECTSRFSTTDACNAVGYVWRRLYKANNPLGELKADYQSVRYIYPAFRLAEMYLIYAEGCNEATDRNAAEAIRVIDLVRERAGLNGIRTAYPEINFDSADAVSTIGSVSKTGKEWLRWIILQERMCEFAFEGQRHYDEIRWMNAMEDYNTLNWTLHLSADNYEDSYTRVSTDYIGGRPVFRERDYLFPFGKDQLAEMTNFTQNPGW